MLAQQHQRPPCAAFTAGFVLSWGDGGQGECECKLGTSSQCAGEAGLLSSELYPCEHYSDVIMYFRKLWALNHPPLEKLLHACLLATWVFYCSTQCLFFCFGIPKHPPRVCHCSPVSQLPSKAAPGCTSMLSPHGGCVDAPGASLQEEQLWGWALRFHRRCSLSEGIPPGLWSLFNVRGKSSEGFCFTWAMVGCILCDGWLPLSIFSKVLFLINLASRRLLFVSQKTCIQTINPSVPVKCVPVCTQIRETELWLIKFLVQALVL